MEQQEPSTKNDILQKRRAFIIHFVYFVIIGGILYLVMKKFMSMFAPFVIGILIATVLTPLIRLLSQKLRVNRKFIIPVVMIAFYLLLFLTIFFFGNRILNFLVDTGGKLPGYYNTAIAPQITLLTDKIVNSFPDQQTEIMQLLNQLEASIQDGIMKISTTIIGWGASVIMGFPGAIVQVIFMVISSFFFTADFDRITGFVLRQFREDRRKTILEVVSSAKTVIWKILRVYAGLMTLTFLELFVGFTILKIPMAFVVALLVAIVDILPVLGTGSVLIPWGIICCVIGNVPLGIGIFVLYLVITIVRQTLEPRIIGHQVGLHPVVTLLCIFAGAKLIGVLGIFLFPVIATVIKKMNDEGAIHIFQN